MMALRAMLVLLLVSCSLDAPDHTDALEFMFAMPLIVVCLWPSPVIGGRCRRVYMLRNPPCPRRSKDHSIGRGFIRAPFQAGRIAWQHGGGASASTCARRCAYVCSKSIHALYLGTSDKPIVHGVGFIRRSDSVRVWPNLRAILRACLRMCHCGYFDAGASKQRKASNEAAPVAVTRKQASQDFAAAMMVLYTVSEVYTSAMSSHQEHRARRHEECPSAASHTNPQPCARLNLTPQNGRRRMPRSLL